MSILAPGTLVGKYPVVRVMSSGGMGMIYEAVHPVLLTRVVIKTVLPTLAGEESIAERFRNEALAASRIRDDRLPQILDIDSLDDGTQYMVMEYLDGEDLQRRLAATGVAADYGVRIIFEILEVLHKVHQIGIIHRDITPRNIFLARSALFGEIPKLLDFGVAHFVNSPNTRPGEVLGSPFYMAPEQIHGRCDLGPWTDVFAAGVVLYEMLSGTGSRPWPTGNLVEYLTAISTRKRPRELSDVAPDLPRGLCDAVMKAIRVDAGARFTDAASFAETIEPFAADRSALYNNSRRPSEVRRSIGPPSSSPDVTTVQTASTQPVIGTDVTMAVPTSQIRSLLPSRPPAAALTGIGQQLAGMIKMPAKEPARPRLREGERRHLTVICLGVQLEGPPAVGLDGEDVDQLIQQITRLLERQIEGLGGHVVPPYDGSIMATFGHELATEEDAEHAVSAALALLDQRREVNATLAQISYTLHLRAGVHSGFVTRERGSGREEVITGATIAAAKLLEHEAPPNGVLVSREALDLLGGRFAEQPFRKLSLKARLDPLEAFEIKGTLGAEVQRWSRGGVAEAFDFVGRKEPLSSLSRVYDRALARAKAQESTAPGSSPQAPATIELCVVSGGAGVGKSRLLHELLVRIGAEPERFTRVFRAEPPSAAPYSVWVALIERMMLLPSDGRRDASLVSEQLAKLAVGLTGPRRIELLSQSDVIASLLSMRRHDLIEHFAPVDQKARIQQTLALTLDAIAAPIPPIRPPIVVLDNVHRADAASLEILGKVLGAMRAAVPPVVLVAVRDADLNLKLPENVTVTRVALEPLSRAEVSAMAAGIAGHPLSPDADRLVQQRAAGNPLFVEEIVLGLGDQNMTRADAANLRSFTVPSSLFGLILSRIDRLEPELRASLQVASVLGLEFTAAHFDDVATALDDSRVCQQALAELERRGLLERRRGAAEESLAFRQVLVRDAVYTTVLRDNKRILHQLAGAAIERRYEGYLDAHLPALFHHYSQTDEIERLVRYARLYGRRALALGAFDDAATALSMAETLRGRLSEADPLPAARTLFELGTALFWVGQLRDAGTRVAEGARLLEGDDRDLVLTLRARTDLLLAEIDYQRAHLGDAVAHLSAAESLFLRAGLTFEAAQARCTRGFQLRAEGRLEEGLALAREGWEILRGSNALSAIVRAGHDLGNILRDVGDYEAAIEVFDRAILAGEELVRSGNSPAAVWGHLAARSGRAMTLAALGRVDEAIAAQRDVYALAVEEHNPVAEVSAGFHLAQHLLQKGNLDEAEQAALRSLHMCTSLGMPAREGKCRALLSEIAARRAASEEDAIMKDEISWGPRRL